MNNELLNQAKKAFFSTYQKEAEHLFFANGRLEILGNHTDHQGGKCLVAGCSLGIYAAVSKRDDNRVEIQSDGYRAISFALDELEVNRLDYGHSIALAKGVIKGFQTKGYRVGGFSACLTSDIFPGAGVSSSAAYELLIAEILNQLFNDGKVSLTEKAIIGKYAENVYFGKPSGLLDQIGASYGGLQLVDFKTDPPRISSLEIPTSWKLHIILVNPGGSHAKLTPLYAKMPKDMKAIAAFCFDKEILSEAEGKPSAVYQTLHDKSEANPSLPSRALRRAVHYFEEVERVERIAKAIERDNRDWFLELERSTEMSQAYLLRNAMVPNAYEKSPLQAVERAKDFLKEGASRVMGGGFAGTTINFVPEEELSAFLKGMRAYYGDQAVIEVDIPENGAHKI